MRVASATVSAMGVEFGILQSPGVVRVGFLDTEFRRLLLQMRLVAIDEPRRLDLVPQFADGLQMPRPRPTATDNRQFKHTISYPSQAAGAIFFGSPSLLVQGG